jgi:hypothetical protein
MNWNSLDDIGNVKNECCHNGYYGKLFSADQRAIFQNNDCKAGDQRKEPTLLLVDCCFGASNYRRKDFHFLYR